MQPPTQPQPPIQPQPQPPIQPPTPFAQLIRSIESLEKYFDTFDFQHFRHSSRETQLLLLYRFRDHVFALGRYVNPHSRQAVHPLLLDRSQQTALVAKLRNLAHTTTMLYYYCSTACNNGDYPPLVTTGACGKIPVAGFVVVVKPLSVPRPYFLVHQAFVLVRELVVHTEHHHFESLQRPVPQHEQKVVPCVRRVRLRVDAQPSMHSIDRGAHFLALATSCFHERARVPLARLEYRFENVAGRSLTHLFFGVFGFGVK
eukprot:466198-Prorocentrum_minimum.AAC.26